MARVIAVIQQKGGVGKSTTVVELASAWGVHRDPHARVLIIDMDAQAGSTRKLGMDPDRSAEQCLVQVLQHEEHALINSRWLSVYPGFGIDVVPAHVDLEGTEAILASRGTDVLRTKLAPVLDQYDYVLLDTRPSLGMLTLNALFAADEVVIPVNMRDPDSKVGARQTLDVIDIARHLGRDVHILGALSTFTDRRRIVTAAIRNYVEDELGVPFLATTIPDRADFANAGIDGMPVNLWRPKAEGATVYRELAAELDQIAPKVTHA